MEFISVIVWGDDIQDSEVRRDTINICITDGRILLERLSNK